MSRLTIDEVIERCDRTCGRFEMASLAKGTKIESKQYDEHYQTSEWLKELKKYKDLEEQGRLVELPCKCDECTYARAVALLADTASDAMTAGWAYLPYEFLSKISNDIIYKVKGVNRVTYDISSKPPATIEWE